MQNETQKCIECDETKNISIMFNLEDSWICDACVRDHNCFGAFDRYRVDEDADYEDFIPLATCMTLDRWSLNGMEDNYMSNEGWGYVGRFGKYLFFHDDRGFRSFEEYPDEARAEAEFDRLYAQGWGAQEDDAYIEGTHVSFAGKPLNVWGRGRWGHPIVRGEGIDQRRCIARVRLEAMKTGYYPNLWLVSDRGNLSLISY
jgi:hypothetical protein